MATIALPRLISSHRPSSNIGPLSSTLTFDAINAQPAQCALPVPNKHMPACPPGPVPREGLNTPPPSPGREEETALPETRSLLYPPDRYARMESGHAVLYKLDAEELATALDHLSRQPLPDTSQVFPWFHGLHPNNQIQQAFFTNRRRALKNTPCCLRGITVVKADGDLRVARLKGAIGPSEFLQPGNMPEFLDVDPQEGFSVRNFQIQAAKAAMTSDIVIYGEDEVVVRNLGWDTVAAQQRWREKHQSQGLSMPTYNTFICLDPFRAFEEKAPDIVAVDAAGRLTGTIVDFFHQERKEMYAMTKASEISHNVWLGPTPDPASEDDRMFDLLVECSDLGRINPAAFQAVAEGAEGRGRSAKLRYLDFPSSGSILAPTWSHAEADGILETCKWLWHISHGTRPSACEDVDGEGDITMQDAVGGTQRFRHRSKKILLHCADGYTESTMLAIAYYSYSTGRPVPDAWLNLHTTMKRNFFAYPTDVALLTAIAPRLLHESPVCGGKALSEITAMVQDEPKWLAGLDGSFPSRIMDYMYLGNLGHANNPDLLKAIGIGQILSVGETAVWRDGELEQWGPENTCIVQGVQDNGIDSLTDEFERCLEFIDQGRKKGTATLVHCRVGVSRSATICIAEVIRTLNMSLPRAYCFVRARRLNVIIQPHLRFAYELLKWEEVLQRRQAAERGEPGTGIKRELEWGDIAREVALMNRPYAR